jgi:RNA polymerase sigma factor (sigma-70 family)
MRPLDDAELLARYVTQRSEEAFATLVERHLSLVYWSALRQVRDPHLAEEIAQAVFIILARKAGSLRRGTVLAGWLCRTAHFAACNALKAEHRRHHHEQEAYMESLLDESEPDVWRRIAPMLDEAVAQLGEADRNAVVLRFYQQCPLEEVGRVLGVNADAAQKRVSRALEKLRKFFTKRGVTLSAVAIAGAVSANSVHAAPVGLAKTISTVALAKGVAVSTSTLTLVKGALTIMAWTKAKTVIAVGLGVLLALGATTVTIHQIRRPKYDPNDFQATTYPTGSPDMMQYMTNSYGHPLNYTFPITPVQLCSINGLLNQCMEVSGWRYLMDKEVAAGSVKFGCPKVFNGEEWVAAFENALQTNTPEWWVAKKKGFRRENLILIRFPKEKTVLVLPKDKAVKYQ